MTKGYNDTNTYAVGITRLGIERGHWSSGNQHVPTSGAIRDRTCSTTRTRQLSVAAVAKSLPDIQEVQVQQRGAI